MRRGFIHNESPLATPKSSKAGMNDESTNEPMDEWELKLLGKKGGEKSENRTIILLISNVML